MASAKRPRTSSSSSSSLATNPGLSSQTTADPPPHKSTRIHPSDPKSLTSHQAAATSEKPQSILCNLPPTCQNRPTMIHNTIELERHYAKFHAHVCSFNNCGSVFPEERFLELHQTECHDPIAALRKDRNEKIFECHIPAPTCGRKFGTPKTRRLHLIQAHNYPKQYFFAVTNKGIGGLLKRWGEGASLIRKEWKPREEGLRDQAKTEEDGDDDNDDDNAIIADPSRGDTITDNDDDDDDDEPDDLDATPRIRPRRILSPTTSSQSSSLKGSDNQNKFKYNNNLRGNSQQTVTVGNVDIEGLSQSLNALSLVPNSVRFGRGGKAKGFAPANYRGRGGAHVKGNNNDHANSGLGNAPLPMEVDVGQDGLVGHGGPPGRGRGARGRGMRMRGRGF